MAPELSASLLPRTPHHVEIRALVAFCSVDVERSPGGRLVRLLLRVLRTGYQHVGVFVRSGDAWACVDPLGCRVAASVVYGTEAEVIHRLTQAGWTVVACTREIDQRRLWVRYIATCASIVKGTLGLRGVTILTPYQISRALVRSGGVLYPAANIEEGIAHV